MRTISNSEFMAHPETYFDMARDGDVRITRGRQMFRLVCEAPHDEPFDEQTGELTEEETMRGLGNYFESLYPDGVPPLLSDEEEIARAISCEELLERIHMDIDRKWAERRK